MKILAAISDTKERKRIASVLVAAHHDVVEAASGSAAAGMLEQGFDIALIDLGAVRAVRVAPPKRIYVIAVLASTAPASDFGVAFDAGADDVMRITAANEEVIGRAGALARIQAWACPAKSVFDRIVPVDDLVGVELGELLGDKLTPAPYAATAVALTSEVRLSLAAEHLEVRLGLGIDRASMAALQHGLLGGDTSAEAIADAMREMANTAAGAIKRAALRSGFELTIGLPSNANVLGEGARIERRAWTLHAANGVTIDCVAYVRSNLPKLVVARDLREGMVLARDVRNPMGMLIAPAGTNLTRTTVEQLGRLLGAAATLEVTDLAA